MPSDPISLSPCTAALSGPPRRPACAACLRPQAACICRWITPTAHQAEVVLLQHPLEVGHAKGSARLLHLSLQRSTLACGEVFEARQLQALLGGPLKPQPQPQPQPQVLAHAPAQAVLLYPDSPQHPMPGLPAPPPVAPCMLQNPSNLRLIVLDGTWRKSRKMLYLNPLLHQLPRLALHGLPASGYRIRKAHEPDQLSTLEAVCAALAQLEGSAAPFQPLLAAFGGFVAQQLACQAQAGKMLA